MVNYAFMLHRFSAKCSCSTAESLIHFLHGNYITLLSIYLVCSFVYCEVWMCVMVKTLSGCLCVKEADVALTDWPSAVCMTEANPSVIAGREL